ncbi:MAG: cyclic pyranopterin monophosphate synthase MoaC [Planctomycetota bacterium]
MAEKKGAHPLRMIDVGAKAVTAREAVAGGRIALSAEALEAAVARALPKGDAITAAELAGIQAAKRVWEIVPLCHPLGLESAEVKVEPAEGGLEITARVRAQARTGVEMEALAAVSAAALTLYDMTKSIDRAAVIGDICLLSKSGGKSGDYVRP